MKEGGSLVEGRASGVLAVPKKEVEQRDSDDDDDTAEMTLR